MRGRERTRLALLAAPMLLVASCTPQSEQEPPTASLAAPSAAVAQAPLPQATQVAATATGEGGKGTARPPAAERVRELAAGIAAELAERCPVRDPADQAAYEACRKAMFGGSRMRSSLSGFTHWGRQNKDPEKTLKETNLTQFGPDVLTSMYLPLFMFTGKQQVTYDTREKLYRVELGARFRNRLQPGQFPYPFWHEDEKWTTYENANAILLWVDPRQMVVRTAQFTARGTLEPASPNTVTAKRQFDGRWMWTDAGGQQQPKVTLFDGLFRADNPHLKKLDASYRELALSLREGQCMACHVPNNPNKMKRLVLLQTPAHAAAEIKRVMDTVRRGRMPVDEISGVEEPMTGKPKQALLTRAAAFEKLVEAAKTWEAERGGVNPPKTEPPSASATPKKSAANAVQP